MSRIVFPHRGMAAVTIPEIMAGYEDDRPVPGLRLHRRDAAATETSLVEWLTRRQADLSEVLRLDAETVMLQESSQPGGGTVGQTMLPVLLERLLREQGIDPRAYAVLMLIEPGLFGIGDAVLEIDRERKRFHTEPQDYKMHLEPGYTMRCNATLPNGVRWNMSAHVIDLPQALPDTVLAGLIGERLGRLISHPLLDRLEVDICDVFHEGQGTTVYYEHATERVSLDDISPLD